MSLTLEGLQGLGGSNVPVRDLVELNKALQQQGLRKSSANAGYPDPQGGTFASPLSGDFSPLVPQSIQNVLDSATFTESFIKLWRMLPKQSVMSTVHESVVINKHGTMNLDPFIKEGGKGTRSAADYERKVVKVKYLGELREISDVATMVGTIGNGQVSKAGLAMETAAGTTALLGKMERALFWGDENVSDLHFNGLYQQLGQTSFGGSGGGQALKIGASSNNYLDLKGRALTINDLIEAVYNVYSSPNYGNPNVIMVEPRTYAALQQQATSYGRFQIPSSGAANLVFANGQLSIAGPTGQVPIESAPLLLPPDKPDAASKGDAPPANPVIGAATNVTTGDGKYGGDGSNFGADEAGSYYYRVVAVGDDGISAPVNSGAVAIASGEVAKITITDAAADTADGKRRYYRLYRSAKDASGAADALYVGTFPRMTAGTDTVIFDDNVRRPDTAPVMIMTMTPDVMHFVQLLDFMRRPLAQTTTTVPFLLMLFGSPHVKVPTKNFILDNVKLGL